MLNPIDMETKDLVLKTDWIRTNSLGIDWYSNDQMGYRYERKDGEWHGDCKNWHSDGRLLLHDVWENGRFVKNMLWEHKT